VVDNGSRVQGSCVSEKRPRWGLYIILVLSVLAFLGFSVVPLLTSTLPSSQPPNRPSPTVESTTKAATPQSEEATKTVKKNELESLLQGYSAVLQREPDNQTALEGLVKTRLQLLREFNQGKLEDLVQPLEKLSTLRPEQTRLAVLLAQVKTQLGDREGAAQTFRAILKTKPGDMFALAGLADLLIKQNRPEAAIGLLQDTLKAASTANQAQAGTINAVSVRVLLGEVYTQLQRYDEAIAAYDLAIQADTKDFRPVFNKAMVFKQQGKQTEAKTLLNTAFALAPSDFKDEIKQQMNLLSPAPTPATPTPPTNFSTPAPKTVATPGLSLSPTAPGSTTGTANSPAPTVPTPSPSP
jgi:tetratricopeptide (TPR) repeat protein